MEHVSPAWAQCIDHFLSSIKSHSGSEESLVHYTSILRRWVAFLDGKPLEHATRGDVIAFMALPNTMPHNSKAGQPVSASAQNSKRSCLSSFYTFASSYEVDGQYLYTRALPTVGLTSQKKNIRARQMSEEEIRRFFSAIPTSGRRGARDRCLFYCYLILGRRRAELLRLRWGDIQPTLINGRPSFTYSYVGKGDSRRVRQKELPGECYQMITDLLRQEGRLEHMQAGDYIFRSSHAPGQPLSPDGIGYRFHLYAKKAQLDTSRVSLHSLRWSSAYHRAMSGSAVTDVRDVLDHTDLAITSRYLSGMIAQADTGAAALSRQFAFLR